MAQYDTILGFKVDLKQLDNLEKQLEGIQNQLEEVSTDFKDVAKDANKASGDMASGFSKLSNIIKGAGIAYALTKIGQGIAYIMQQASNAQQELANLESVIKSTGGVAGFTAQQIDQLSTNLSKSSIFSAGEINEAAARLLTYTDIVGEEVPRAMQTIVDWSARYNVSLVQAAETVGKAIQKPSEAAAALSRQGFKFTDEFIKKLKELEQAGKLAEAQTLMFEQIEEGTKGASEALRNTFGGAIKALRNSLNDLVTADDGSLDGATQGINRLTDTLNDPQTKSAFSGIINLLSELGAKLVETSAQMANFYLQGLKLKTLNVKTVQGTELSTSDEAQQRLNQLNTRINALQLNTFGKAADSVFASSADLGYRRDSGAGASNKGYTVEKELNYLLEARAEIQTKLKDLTAEQAEIERKRAAELKALSAANTGSPSSKTSTSSSSKKPAKSEAEKEAERLEKSYQNLNDSLTERIALFGKSSNVAQVAYTTEFGNLSKLTEAQKTILLNQAKELDNLQLKQTLGGMALETMEYTKQAQLINSSIIPGTTAWRDAQRQISIDVYTASLRLQKVAEEDIPALVDAYTAAREAQDNVTESSKSWSSVMKENITDMNAFMQDNFINVLGGAFDALWEGSSKGFEQMLADMAKQMAKSMFINLIMSFFGGGNYGTGMQGFSNRLMGTPQANGGAWNKGTQFFESGGIVNRATPFGMANGKMGVMGEAGPEAILPLTRGSNGKLGVQMEGGGGVNVVIGAGAVVVNATDNPQADANATAQALKTMIDTRVSQILKDSMRTGNMLNRTRSGNY